MLSVIIPTLNANASLPGTLACLSRHADVASVNEYIIADGGSDEAPDVEAPGAVVLTGPPGRGLQLATGAQTSSGEWLLFLHADTILADGWAEAVRKHMAASSRAAFFRFRLDDDSAKARFLEWLVYWRCVIFALPYGDQGLLISRKLYEEVGGFRPLPLMEDVDLVRRIGRSRLTPIDIPAVTSAERYVRDGYLARILRNLTCLAMWSVGISPDYINRFYK